MLDVTPATVSRWERQPARVTIPVLRNLAMALSCDPADLLLPTGRRRPDTNTSEGGMVVLRSITSDGAGMSVSADFLRLFSAAPVSQLAVMRVPGESMEPTLIEGDLCLVDTAAGFDRNGLYCLRSDGGIAYIRRLSIRVNGTDVVVSADSPRYPDRETVPLTDLPLVGRVIARFGCL